jgi:peroxiredoxin
VAPARRTRLAAAALAAAVLFPAASRAADGPEAPPRVGAPLPEFDATSLGGEVLSLRTAVGTHKAVVILFLSTVCRYANYFASHVRELDERYGKLGVLFVGVNSNSWETRDEVAAHVKAQGWAFPMVKDEGQVIADRLAARATPEAFLVDAEGRLRYRGWVKSRQESPDLQRALDDVLAGRPVRRADFLSFIVLPARPTLPLFRSRRRGCSYAGHSRRRRADPPGRSWRSAWPSSASNAAWAPARAWPPFPLRPGTR